ncbi:MAG: endonuclease/exonuclease/phosphatase [Bacteroidetes bacterium]|jgi:predicted extracellular nuclease|nr:endonuclease/exonuclease/phosphatase [Bacteroidota bacterium]MBT6686436.1 endonuclease/exonuclease/phosphatase [Bacteroidota bacterium]MBT7144675.1 endonuclease/exonuclease/phosphatase [Bacteroidota bacterium]MBT7491290.1 endonuclease/exonuclease/phosphatase [Bacteroidota bacterium]
MNQKYFIAWWNVENLFDMQNSASRPAWLQSNLNSELSGWDSSVLSQKISQLAQIIMKMNDDKGPDILGLCEIENIAVLKMLQAALYPLNRKYAIAHVDMEDERGIDIAFIYDKTIFNYEEQFNYVVRKRSATRDIFQVNFKTNEAKDIVFIGNHWPAKSGGSLESEPYRIIAAETLSYWIERIHEIKGNNIAIVVMGDFNDEPFSRSITEYALSTHLEMKVRNSFSPRLLNLMWDIMSSGLGTYYYDNFANVLDQFLVSKAIVNENSDFKLAIDTNGKPIVKIEMFPEMVSGGDYPDPIRFGRPSSQYNASGFSDHYPISMILEEIN